MKAVEKKIAEKLSIGEFKTIKATDELIENIIDTAREKIEEIKNTIEEEEKKLESLPQPEENENTEEEKDPSVLRREQYLKKLNQQLEYFENIVTNGETYLEKLEKAEELFDVYDEE